MYTQVPSKYKFKPAIVSILGKCASNRDVRDAIKLMHVHIDTDPYGNSDYFRRSELLDVVCFLAKPL